MITVVNYNCKLMLNLTEQLSMHLFDLDKWKVVKSLACPWMVGRTTVCTEQKYFLFYLFYFIKKVYTDFISWGKKTLYSVSLFLSPWLTHKATSSAFVQKNRQIEEYIFTLYSALRAGSLLPKGLGEWRGALGMCQQQWIPCISVKLTHINNKKHISHRWMCWLPFAAHWFVHFINVTNCENKQHYKTDHLGLSVWALRLWLIFHFFHPVASLFLSCGCDPSPLML